MSYWNFALYFHIVLFLISCYFTVILSLNFFLLQLYWGCNWHLVSCTYLKYTIWWALTYVYTHENIITIWIMNLSITSRSFLVPHCDPCLSLLSLLPQSQTRPAFCHYTFSRILYKWNLQSIYTFFGLSSFAQLILFGFWHVVACNNSTFLLIPGYTIVWLYHNLFTHLSFERHLSSSQFWLLQVKLLLTQMCEFLYGHMLYFSWKTLKGGVAVLYGWYRFSFLRNYCSISQSTVPLYILTIHMVWSDL